MFRLNAVRALLFDAVGLRVEVEPEDADRLAVENEILDRAIRRSGAVAALDLTAIVLLFLFRERGASFLPLGPSEDSVLTFGVLAVAVHLGFRLAQLIVFRGARRVLAELPEEVSGSVG